jgi:glycosyltransferase involved in cell wall biosynthesis
LLCKWTTLIDRIGDLCTGPENFRKCLECYRHRSWIANRAMNLTAGLDENQWLSLTRFSERFSERFSHRRIGILELGQESIQRLVNMRQQAQKNLEIITPSEWTKKLLVSYGFQSERIHVVSHGTQYPSPIKRQTFSKNNTSRPIRFGYLGRIHPTKGIDILIDAYKKVRLEGSTQLDIFGESDHFEQDYYKRIIDSSTGIPEIKFHGKYSSDQVGSILENLDIVIIPSIWYEVFSLIVLEAALAGVPVIASDLGGLAENVRMHQAGWLFPARDIEALAALMTRCRDEMDFIDNQVKLIQKPKSIETEVEEIHQIYHKIIIGQTMEDSSAWINN